ncbi:glycoside hydrolase 5 family protein [Natrinema salsiterrestre]|uniref:mannan endo-1,4-beta-mannosidase n=1 Tax=Natrinema salsiterrestre TaxID=2950540 RepID=A0A9Q4Q100_9EURY|nr:cellulase family glycosylhydrolase [Natrinema salsiterrestre]MDF9747285.1 cellulase family glycosylhydrolase [Natrinema salsiterrestre]
MTRNEPIADGRTTDRTAQHTRRRVVKVIGAGAAIASTGVGTAAAAAEPTTDPDDLAFVETDGTEFVAGGEPVYFNGANNFWITHEYEGTRQRIDDVLDLYRELGIDLVRFWAHGEGKDGPLALQPEPGEYNEEALQNLDYLIEAARERGIRLIATLVDNWDHEGGMLQYAEWAGGESRYEFYTMDETREMYRTHVETILTRENSISGIEWREDPTIMLWELANEPRLEQDDVPADMDSLEPPEHREILGTWFEDMSAYVKALDGNHLVSTGSEGHYYGTWEDEYPDGNWDGQDYVAHHSIETIDACSFHLYPDHWNVPLEEGAEYIRNRVVDAHEEIGKPAYLGEFNVDDTTHDLETKNETLASWYDVADEYDCNAVLPWQVVLEETQDHDGFQLYASESGHLIEEYAAVVDEKSGGSDPETIPVGEYEARDLDDDGLYEDVNGDNETTHGDVNALFEHRDADGIRNNPEQFDFDGNGRFGFSDILALLEEL